MNSIITDIPKNLILQFISTISSSILNIHNLYNFITTQQRDDYKIFQNELIKSDIITKVMVITSIIKDIIHKYHSDKNSDINSDINKLLDNYSLGDNDSYYIIENNFNENNINLFNNDEIFYNIAEPLKITILSNLEIIDKINNTLLNIQSKIINHKNSYLKIFTKINIEKETNDIIIYNIILEKRLFLLLELIKIFT